MSKYLEHLATSRDAPNGRAVVLQPNPRLVGGAHLDFADHRVAVTDRSLAEAIELAGLRTGEGVARFPPHSTKSRLPRQPALTRAYLAVPRAWLFLGKQTLSFGACLA